MVAGPYGWLWEPRGWLSGVADGGGAVLGMWTAVGVVRGWNGWLWGLSGSEGRGGRPPLADRPRGPVQVSIPGGLQERPQLGASGERRQIDVEQAARLRDAGAQGVPMHAEGGGCGFGPGIVFQPGAQ